MTKPESLKPSSSSLDVNHDRYESRDQTIEEPVSSPDEHEYKEDELVSMRSGSNSSSDATTILCGILGKKRTSSSVVEKRWVEVKPGYIYWYKLSALSRKIGRTCSCRSLAGCTIDYAGVGSHKHTITIHFSFAPGTRISPIRFTVLNEIEQRRWIHAFTQASTSWQVYRNQLTPYSGPRSILCGLIVVEVVRAHGLIRADWGSDSDPYTIVEFDDCRARTRIVMNNCNPEWAEVLTLPVFYQNQNYGLSFYVYDADDFGADDFLGMISIPLHALGNNTEKVWQLNLKAEEKKVLASNQEMQNGTLTVRTYFHTSNNFPNFPFTQLLNGENRPQPPSKTFPMESFSIFFLKLQIDRITKAFSVFKSLASLRDLIQWRNPKATLPFYVCVSSLILFFYDYIVFSMLAGIGLTLILNHPEFPQLNRRILKPLGASFEHSQPLNAALKSLVGFKTTSSTAKNPDQVESLEVASDMEILDGSSDEGIVREDDIIRVWECERRNVSATAAALIGREHSQSSLFKRTFSSKYLKSNEAKWRYLNGSAAEAAPGTIKDGLHYQWKLIVSSSTSDANGWEYSAKWPPAPETSWGESGFTEFFSSSFRLHSHWVRRRLWEGIPTRPAEEGEVDKAVGEEGSDIVQVEEGVDDIVVATERDNVFRAFYKTIVEEGVKLQKKFFNVASGLEAVLNFTSWKNRELTSIFFLFIICAICAASFLPQRVIFWFIFSGVLGDQFSDFLDRQKQVKQFLKCFAQEAAAMEKLDDDIQKALVEYADHPFTPIHAMSEIPSYVLHLLTQKSADVMHLNVSMSLQDFTDCKYLGEYAEKCFCRAFGDEWFMREIGGHLRLRPRFMILNHSTSNWDKFDFFSVKYAN